MRSSSLLAALIVCLAVASGVRLLDVAFLCDDQAYMGYVERSGSLRAWTNSWTEVRAPLFHRPVVAALYHVDVALLDADPRKAHAHALLWHALAAVLLFVLLRQLCVSRAGAFLGSALFVLHPYDPISVGWIAARGGTVCATLTLLATVLCLAGLRRERRGILFWASMLAAVLAASTKETGYVALLVPLLVDLVLRRTDCSLSALARRHAPFAIAGCGLLLLRWYALGTPLGGYGTPEGLLAGGPTAREYLASFGRDCLSCLGGVREEYGTSALLPIAICALSALLVIAGLRRELRGRGALLLLVMLVLQLLLILLIAGSGVLGITAQRWYVVTLFLCALLGMAGGPLLRRRWALMPLALLVLYGAGHWRGQEIMLGASRYSEDVRAAIGTSLEQLHPSAEAVFVTGLPEGWNGVPLFWVGLYDSFRPPFRDAPPVPIFPVHRNLRLAGYAPWPEHPPVEALLSQAGRSLTVLKVNTHDGPLGPAFGGLTRLDLVGARGSEISRKTVEMAFPAPPLKVLRPEVTDLGDLSRPLDLTLEIDARDLERVDLFCFFPGKSMRLRYPVSEDVLHVDPSITLEVPAFFLGEPLEGLLLPVGFDGREPPGVRLGPLLLMRSRFENPR